MFDNIGKRLQSLAKFLCTIGIIGSVVMAFVMFMNAINSNYYDTTPYVLYGFIFLIGGSLVSWLSSWVLYGIGEVAENSALQLERSLEIIKKLDNMKLSKNQAQGVLNTFGASQANHKENRVVQCNPSSLSTLNASVPDPTLSEIDRIRIILDKQYSDEFWLLTQWDHAGFPEVEPYISTRKKLKSAQSVEEAKKIIRQDYGYGLE